MICGYNYILQKRKENKLLEKTSLCNLKVNLYDFKNIEGLKTSLNQGSASPTDQK